MAIRIGRVRLPNRVAEPVGRLDWSLDHVLAFGSRDDFSPRTDDPHVKNAAVSDPGFGACRLWCPDGAACKGAASDGGDLGATVLYKYENGVLTKEPLWDPSTGAFLGAGAIVPGVNDVAGASLFDIANRLNVNRNGCAFPAGYAASGGPRAAPRRRRPGPLAEKPVSVPLEKRYDSSGVLAASPPAASEG